MSKEMKALLASVIFIAAEYIFITAAAAKVENEIEKSKADIDRKMREIERNVQMQSAMLCRAIRLLTIVMGFCFVLLFIVAAAVLSDL